MPGIIVIGVGPGIGVSVARRFAREGLPVGVIARSQSTVDAALRAVSDSDVAAFGVTADAGDEVALVTALDDLIARLGVPDVVVYNAAIIQFDAIGELTAHQHLQAWAVNVVGAITTAARLLPAMAERGTGTFVITGGMPVPVPDVVSLSLGKAGVRAFTEMLDTRYAPSGVHVATVTVGGAVAPNTAFDPDVIADDYWRVHVQPRGSWEREVMFGGVLPT
jgi:NAD(P)-dependent dehydrogenase (short-subunit alcohol dehydrogenase family)